MSKKVIVMQLFIEVFFFFYSGLLADLRCVYLFAYFCVKQNLL